MWRFDPAIAGPRARGESRGLERLKELQTREGWLGQLWKETGKEVDGGLCAVQGRISSGAAGGGRSSLSIHPWEKAFLSSIPLWCGSLATLELTISLLVCVLLPSHAIWTTSAASPSGTKPAYRMEKAGTRLGVRKENCAEGLCHPHVATDPILIFLTHQLCREGID